MYLTGEHFGIITCFGICFTFLSGSLFFVDVYASVVWGRLGHARISCELVLLLVSLAWEV